MNYHNVNIPIPRIVWYRVARKLKEAMVIYLHKQIDCRTNIPAGSAHNHNIVRLTDIAKHATQILHEVAYEHSRAEPLLDWRIDIFEPAKVAIYRTITLVAVDPNNIAHDIETLMDGLKL